jgi:tyrosyl-tRNA synthetase
MLYPLMQGYDSVAIKADVELGGVDQWFNLLSGRVMQQHYKQKPQDIMTTSLLMGLDGRKMSSSWGNTINITESPNDMFGKTMSLKDELIREYFLLATEKEEGEIEEILSHGPRDAKVDLATSLVELYHGKTEAEKAKRYFIETFAQKKAPEEVMTLVASPQKTLCEILVEAGVVSSKSDFTRLVQQGAVMLLPDNKVTEAKEMPVSGGTYKIGKHRFVKIQ